MKKAARKAARARAKAIQKELSKFTCSIEGCERPACGKHECLACEKLERPEPYVAYGCKLHHEEAAAMARRHAIVKHPTNMLRVLGAALAGEGF